MKIRKLIHHLLLTISLAFGAIITGTTINAQAQQLNTSNTTANNESNNQDINISNKQIDKPRETLVQASNQNQNIENNYYNEQLKNNSYNQNINNLNISKKYSVHNNLKSRININSNKINSNTIHQKTNNIYNNILLNITRKDNALKSNNLQNNKPKNFIKYNNNNLNKLNIPTMRLSALSHYSNRNLMRHKVANNQNWFRDGLNKKNFEARSWVSWHESNHRWRALSYGGICVGYFQLSPSYLGYRHGHVNLSKKHQVKVADAYVRNRYGNWINAKRFWEVHHWY